MAELTSSPFFGIALSIIAFSIGVWIQKKTGLDVRVFDDALTFKIALMVANHMKSLQTPEDKATMYTN